MKKVIFAIVGALALTTVVSSCNKKEDNPQGDSKLATPKNITVKEITAESVTLTWDAVKGAELYAYIVDAAEAGETKGETATNEVTLKVATNVEHTFAVKATAAGKTDSDFAQFTIHASFTATIEVSDITCNSAVMKVTPGGNDSYAAVYIDEETFNQLTEAEILSTIASNVEAGQWPLYQGEQSIPLSGLKHSTKHYALVVGFESKNEPISNLLKKEFTTLVWEGPSEAIQAWLGEYTFTYEKAVRWYVDDKNYIHSEIQDTTITKKVEIVPLEGESDAALIYGISNLDEITPEPFPAIAVLGDSSELLLMNDIPLADPNQGFAPTWLSYCYCASDSKYYIVTGKLGAYSLKDGEGTPYAGEFDGGQGSYNVVSFAIFACPQDPEAAIQFYDLSKEKTEAFHPAGKITYTKKSDEPASTSSRKFFQMGNNLKPTNIKNLSAIKSIEM